jgi:formiminotetrahydrofolate cyclodeaminase
MDDYTELSVDAFLDQVAERTPTPGGGGVAGLAGALACAMGRMVAGYSVNKQTEPAVRAQVESVNLQLQRADELMRALITRDADAYTAMTEAAKAPGKHAPARAAYHEAVLAAISVPMEAAALSSNTLSTLDEFKESASRNLLSDLGVAAVLADAAAQAAAYSVWVNARELGDTSLRAKIISDTDKTIDHCARHRKSIEAYVRSHLEIDSTQSR